VLEYIIEFVIDTCNQHKPSPIRDRIVIRNLVVVGLVYDLESYSIVTSYAFLHI
jgi:hypothetical protein